MHEMTLVKKSLHLTSTVTEYTVHTKYNLISARGATAEMPARAVGNPYHLIRTIPAKGSAFESPQHNLIL